MHNSVLWCSLAYAFLGFHAHLSALVQRCMCILGFRALVQRCIFCIQLCTTKPLQLIHRPRAELSMQPLIQATTAVL